LAWVSGAVAAALAVVPVGAAFAVGGGGSARVSAAADDPDSTVEDYRYPDADKILNDFKVKLISGDGHIVFADCAKSPASGDIGFIKVRTTEEIGQKKVICFEVRGDHGLLNMEVPAVYEIRGDGLRPGKGHQGTADITTDSGTHTTVKLNPAGNTAVGIGVDSDNEPTTLLQLKITS
jgi:hypothetical protein